jgi:large subunit ribosomal protein L29
MRIEEVRQLNTEALREELENARKELFNLRFQKATQQLSDSNAIRKTRRTVARAMTVLRERELADEAPQG